VRIEPLQWRRIRKFFDLKDACRGTLGRTPVRKALPVSFDQQQCNPSGDRADQQHGQ
jgi:hypothetical protein